MIEDYKPKRAISGPVEIQIVITDETPVFQYARRIPYTEEMVVDERATICAPTIGS